MSSAERDEELLSLQAIYCDTFNTFELVDDRHFNFHSPPVILRIMLPLSYPAPAQSPEIRVDSGGLGVSQLEMSHLQMRLEAMLQSKPEQVVLFDLTEETREFCEELREAVGGSLGEMRMCPQEEEEARRGEYNMDEPDKRVTDLALVQSHMGSRTIEKIVSRLCKSDQPVHAEVVLRSDLRERYLKMRQEMQQAATQRLPDRREKDVMWEYGQEEIVFHGTSYKNVGSIVRSGFVVPGQRAASGKAIGIRCGTTWGQGIYTSPSPSYGLRYANYAYKDGMKGRHRLLPGQKLIVCAVLMGRRHHVVTPRRLNTNVEPGFDSHVSPNKKEYIVFNSAQVLPLYVLHLGYQHVPSADPGLPMSLSLYQPGNLTEYARKHLPTGYGVARGHKFVVTAIAPADDDEELWGQYQYTNADEWDGFEEDD